MKKKAIIWVMGYLIIVFGILGFVAFKVIKIDPFFHYRKPDTSAYYYTINSQRNQNDGIAKYFDYDTMITGTSMAENFMTSECDEIFGGTSVKLPFSGGRYKEINNITEVGLKYNPNLKTVIRSIDLMMVFYEKDSRREDLGEYPDYLYDNNIFNDVKYLFNREVVFLRIYHMEKYKKNGTLEPGIRSFDDYSNWNGLYKFGRTQLCPSGVNPLDKDVIQETLDEDEIAELKANIKQNITGVVEENPDVTFYYFFPPYSVLYIQNLINTGKYLKNLEAQKIIIEECLKYDNIKIYGFEDVEGLATNLNHYRDASHYGQWVNSMMLRCMKEERYIYKLDNYEKRLQDEMNFYLTYDYEGLNQQPIYENKYYAAAILAEETNGTKPLNIMDEILYNSELENSKVIDGCLVCEGRLERAPGGEVKASDYVKERYIGAKIEIEDISSYSYLVFYGINENEQGQPFVGIYDEEGNLLVDYTKPFSEVSEGIHQYLVDVSDLSGKVSIIFSGGGLDNVRSTESVYSFTDAWLY